MRIRFQSTNILPVYIGGYGEFREGEYEVEDKIGNYLISTFPDNFTLVEEIETEDKITISDEVTDESDTQCQAITLSGKRCSRKALPGEKFCAIHLKMQEDEE